MEKLQPKYVTFEQGKLLKEKGFNVPTKKFYELALTSKKDKEHGYSGSFGWKKGECNLQEGYFINNLKDCDYSGKHWFMCSAPEQWVVVEWLRVNHDIWVSVNIAIDDKWYFELYNLKDKRNAEIIIEDENVTDFYNSPQEACSAAFDYILKNLI